MVQLFAVYKKLTSNAVTCVGWKEKNRQPYVMELLIKKKLGASVLISNKTVTLGYKDYCKKVP